MIPIPWLEEPNCASPPLSKGVLAPGRIEHQKHENTEKETEKSGLSKFRNLPKELSL